MAAPVSFYFNLLSFSFLIILCSGSENLIAISPSQIPTLIKDEPFVAFFLTNDKCKTCHSAANVLSHIITDASEIDVKLVKTDHAEFAKQYGVDVFPNLLYFRNQKPMIFDGGFVGEEILSWLASNKETFVVDLDDQSFEHLTQASTGATTGDWLVLFYQPIPSIQVFMPTWDTVAGRLKDKVNVAKVDLADSKDTAERFHITDSSSILFFRHGKIYHYDLPKKDVLTLIAFASNWYKNVEGRPVPHPLSPFDKLISQVRKKIKGENGIVYISVGVSAVLLVFVFILKYLNRDVPEPASATKKKA